MTKSRCDWCQNNDLLTHYHDEEWGVPLYDDLKLFEFLILEGAQAGLSWLTILKRREQYRLAFDQFNPEKIVHYTPKKIEELMNNAGIIRNRLKIESAIKNARRFLELKEKGSFSDFIWQFVNGTPIVNRLTRGGAYPVSSEQSDALSKELKSRGFNFVGTVICYAYMQAVGMVNDHFTDCYRFKDIIHG